MWTLGGGLRGLGLWSTIPDPDALGRRSGRHLPEEASAQQCLTCLALGSSKLSAAAVTHPISQPVVSSVSKNGSGAPDPPQASEEAE